MPALEPVPKARSERFVVNVIWNWIGVAVSLATGFLLSPYLFRKLGPEGYGIWSLSFSLIEYYWLLDLGFRSATAKFVAHYWATEELGKMSEVVSTALCYACLAAALIFGVVLLAVAPIEGFFRVSPSYQAPFRLLLITVTISWCLGLVFNLFSAALEAVQRFDITNRITILSTGSRALVWFAVLYSNRGLVALGIATLISQCFMYGLNYYYFRRALPDCKVSRRFVGVPMLRQMWNYGIHTFLQTVSLMGLNQAPPILIGHFLPAAFVGFYNLPVRLLQYTAEFIGRIGVVTNVNAAALAARNESTPLNKLAVFSNRYCLVIFMPLAILLWTYGRQFFDLWIGPAGAAQAAPLLPILLIGYLIGVASQYSSGMILLGLGKHQGYAKALFVEAVVVVTALWLVIPKWGILGAAWTCAVLMVASRGIFALSLVSRTIGLGFWSYASIVYVRPILTAAPATALAFLLRTTILPGMSWFQIFAAGALIGIVYYALALPFCLDPEHLSLLWNWRSRRLHV